ncbi:MAG: long-chain fatty acid--CoA ligase [Lamprocystis purpurea]|nr:long-chain fatty acid--CoA ligase [Lamprocystis purpurea]
MHLNESSTPIGCIGCDAAGTLPGLFRQRVAQSPAAVAYQQFEDKTWRDYTWSEVAARVARWQQGLAGEGLQPGDRVALSLRNSVDWVCFDQAALGLGLVPVPLYITDSPDNLAHILGDSGARLLLLDSDRRWSALASRRQSFPELRRVLCLLREVPTEDESVRYLTDWLPDTATAGPERVTAPDTLATIVYTSGTTGRPKGVMLSHRGILWTAEAVLRRIPAWPTDSFLSFLPLAHGFERTVGYYLPMMAGSRISFARSVELLRQDLLIVRPTVLLAVPRVYDKIYLAIQTRLGERGLKRRLFDTTVDLGWRQFRARQGQAPALGVVQRLTLRLLRRLVAAQVLDRLGGRLRVAVSGGAPLSPVVARFFIGLGLPLTEGYGLTETSPVLSNTRPEDCIPGSVGRPLPGLEVRIGPADELLVRTPGMMLGYWNHPEATAGMIDADGWLRTGDVAEVRDGYLYIRGRLKEILVTSAGEKVSPVEMEMALTMDPLFAQAMVLGEGRPYLAALLVLEPDLWTPLAEGLGLDPRAPTALQHPTAVAAILARVRERLRPFPGYAQVRAVHLSLEPWTIENGLITPTTKVKRYDLETRFAPVIRQLYRHREVPQDPS